jgi:hypothetical protein
MVSSHAPQIKTKYFVGKGCISSNLETIPWIFLVLEGSNYAFFKVVAI